MELQQRPPVGIAPSRPSHHPPTRALDRALPQHQAHHPTPKTAHSPLVVRCLEAFATCCVSSEIAELRHLADYPGPIAAKKIALTQALATEWAPGGVRVGVAIAPFDVIPEIFGDVVLQAPLKRRGVPRELSDTVVYLASDDVSFVIGETRRLDGVWGAFQMY